MGPQEIKPDIVKGSFFALIAFFLMALFGIMTKLALMKGSVIWVSFLTYLIGAVALGLLIAPKGLSYLKSGQYPKLLGRALFGSFASLLYTFSILFIPIVNATLLFNTAPIFIPILAIIFLKARIEKSVWLAILLGFIGIIVIIKPTEALFTQPGNLIALTSGLFLAIAYLLMKTLTKTDPGVRIIFYYLAIGTLIQMPLVYFAGAFPPIKSSFFALLSGIILLGAQLSLIQAYKYADASKLGIYQYTSIVFVGLFDWMLFGALPNFSELAGIILVAVAGTIIIKTRN